MIDIKQKRFEQFLALRLEAHHVASLPDRLYEFTCPVCGGRAHAVKAGLNGHVHVACEKCCMQNC